MPDLNGVAEKITGALDAHNEAVKPLSTGKGTALSIGDRVRGLGVKTKKPMPPMLVDGVADHGNDRRFRRRCFLGDGRGIVTRR